MNREILDNYLFEAFANASDNIYIYVTDIKKDLSRWSQKAIDFFGLESEYFYNAKDIWLEHIHPDDRQVYIDDIEAVFNGTSVHHNCQYRARNKYGEYVWVECRGSVINDSEGMPLVFAGIMTRIDNLNKYDNLTHLLTAYELFNQAFDKNGTIMMVGIDGFRNINSQYGLMYGNRVLVYLSELLTSLVPDATVYRFRGDEFAIYSDKMNTYEMAAIFRRAYTACSGMPQEENLASFSISGGIAEFPKDGDNVTEILSRLELSLEYAKSETNSHLAIFSSDIEAKQNRRNMIAEELLRSINNNFNGFRLFFQPILSNEGDQVVGCETLLRWNTDREEIGACYPDEFIPILENNGGIIAVGYYVMKEAIRQVAEWQKRFKKFYVSFNVSYLQLEDPDFVPSIIETVKEYNVDTSCVIVELTESVLAADTVMVKNSFDLLKQHGIQIALDDFGTGNSSFWLLHNLDVDIVKLDQSFIRGLDDTGVGVDHAIVESVGLMCNRIGYKTIAEGVETETIRKIISKYNFSGLQGYLFSKPVAINDFEMLLKKYNMEL